MRLFKVMCSVRHVYLYFLTRNELRYTHRVDPKGVYGEDFPGETFRVLKDKEMRQYGKYRTRRLVLEKWVGKGSSTMSLTPRLSPQKVQENISRKQLGEFLELHEFVTVDITPDLGEDILVRIYDKGVSTGLSFYIQLKSVDSVEKHLLKSGDISYPFEVRD